MHVSRRNLLFSSLAVPFCATKSVYATIPEVELCLMFDCSASMFSDDGAHARTQLRGHVEALNRPDIQSLWLNLRPVVSLFAWSEIVRPLYSKQVSDTADFAELQKAMLTFVPHTSLSPANTIHSNVLRYFVQQQKTTIRRVVDISTDEAPHAKFFAACQQARDQLFETGTKVNVLSIDSRGGDMTKQLQNSVATSNGFVRQIESFADYGEGIAQKLLEDMLS